MSRIKNTAEVKTYNDNTIPSNKEISILIHSHWNRREFVELEIRGERFVVLGSDLKKAIDNCMNVGI
jgi:hypothetical protein